MDYWAVYDSLMLRAINREVDGYVEKHHIVPRCLGGSNDRENIVRLTAREHILAHKLLVRMYPSNAKLWHSLMMMGRIKLPVSRITAAEREAYANIRREFRYSDESRSKMSDSAKKRGRNSPGTEFSKGLSPWNKGIKNFRLGYSHSDETRAKMIETKRVREYDHSARMTQWWADRKADTQRIGG
jgi:hypothetical protein